MQLILLITGRLCPYAFRSNSWTLCTEKFVCQPHYYRNHVVAITAETLNMGGIV